jgi:hypothetical protein
LTEPIESETLVVPAPEELARVDDPPPRQPKTTEEKAGLVDGVRNAAKTHKTAMFRRIQLETDLRAARITEAQSLEALHAARYTLKLESEVDE